MQFIGSFIVQNNILIYDPAVNDIVAERFNLCEENLNRLEINSCPGTWNAYHIYNSKSAPEALLLINTADTFFYENIDSTTLLNELCYVDHIVTAFGHMVVAVDKVFAENNKYTYINNSNDMTYRIRDIKHWLLQHHADNKELLRDILKREKAGETFIDSDILYEHYGDCHIPYQSDLWAADCRFRLKNSSLESTVIQGGVVSLSYSYMNKCYVDDPDHCKIIYISLTLHNNDNKPSIKVV